MKAIVLGIKALEIVTGARENLEPESRFRGAEEGVSWERALARRRAFLILLRCCADGRRRRGDQAVAVVAVVAVVALVIDATNPRTTGFPPCASSPRTAGKKSKSSVVRR